MKLEITNATAPVTPATPPSKMMLLAVYCEAGQLKIKPINTGPEPEPPKPSTAYERARAYLWKVDLFENLWAMKQALNGLYGNFETGLYRSRYNTFADFCHDLFDLYTTPEDEQIKKELQETKVTKEQP